MTPHPLSELDRLEARRRHPAGRDPQTGRALPERIPAAPSTRYRAESVACAVVAGCVIGTSLYAIAHLVTGGAL